ncbi:L-fucose/L-arabinose isomerase family protein [Faecalicatena orotica]|uniref:FucIase n=1 Tax=Faecalicatena orotica TaxID=1544 RepID=A0A2Y9BNJ2_9FIRM|nr:L-fucose/L-arabinose isomerase family protein [Faecalicatena orotica]PWJ23688.1 L-fucose isomerase [Faecalicatena orotica]SSA57600.1 L-fucose isomerase [Faecalicatena orotica]
MKKIKVGILTMSDGRDYLHQEYEQINMEYQEDIKEALEGTGLFEVVAGNQPINSNEAAKREAKKLEEAGVEATIFNYTIWCYPQYTAVAQNFAPGPYLLFCNLHPSECGMVGMMAAAGTLEQLDVKFKKLWGSVKEPEVLDKMTAFLKAAAAVKRLRGMTFGNFGGRPLGMYTAVANLEQWQKEFGIDVENVEQDDIIRAGEKAADEKVEHAFAWLSELTGKIEYDGEGLTPEKLKQQIRSYYGLRDIISKRGLDFIGIKAHGDLTDRYVTMDLAEALLNDPYDFDGPKEPIVAATESDMDGALTMQIFKLLTGMPVLFADVRHYDKENDVWFFSNSGTHATYFAGASMDPGENLKNVTLYPETHYYPAGGASVHHFAKEGEVTLARLARKNGKYSMTIVPARIVQFDKEKMAEMGNTTTPAWPVAFTRIQVPADEFIEKFPCNHIHGVYGNYVEELKLAAELLNMDIQILQ